MGRIQLSTARDYRIVLPRTRAFINGQGLSIYGGHNVVVIGGLVDVQNGYSSTGKTVRRAAYIRNVTGTFFAEGLRFMTSTARSLTEGIDLDCPGATVRLQNIYMASILRGSQSTNHADVVQSWAGPRQLGIDGLTATTSYQGFFLLPQQHSSAAVSRAGWDLRRIFLKGLSSAYLLWREGTNYPIRASEVYVSGSTRQHGGMWPSQSQWRFVKIGTPPHLFGTTAGLNYRSPGYL